MKVIVQQAGARMDYAVPRALHAEGLLAALVTDLYFARPPRWRRLRSYSAGLPLERVVRSNGPGLLYRALMSRGSARFWPHLMAAEALAERTVAAARRLGADMVYGFDTAMLPGMGRLRRQGVAVVMEQCVAPRAQFLETVAALERKLPEAGVAVQGSGLLETEAYFATMTALEREEWPRADRIYCPSPYVRDALVAEGVAAGKIRTVPYGVTLPDRPARPPAAETGGRPRVVFGGSFSWRKGALEFGRAATALRDAATFEAYGKVTIPPEVARRIAPHVRLHGHRPRAAFHAALAGADIFVLPSYMEGSATVVYEAMAMGLPCVVTGPCGSIITDGVDGQVVAAGDDAALQAALAGLLDDAALRREMGAAAAVTARRYTRESYGARVVAALREDHAALRGGGG